MVIAGVCRSLAKWQLATKLEGANIMLVCESGTSTVKEERKEFLRHRLSLP